jgi:hypothetical protein
MSVTIIKVVSVLTLVMVALGYALRIAHEHDNSLMCERYGGEGAVYKNGVCRMPMGNLNG